MGTYGPQGINGKWYKTYVIYQNPISSSYGLGGDVICQDDGNCWIGKITGATAANAAISWKTVASYDGITTVAYTFPAANTSAPANGNIEGSINVAVSG